MIAEATFDSHWFTEFLEETKAKVDGQFTAEKWLRCIDSDSLQMLQGYIDNFDDRTPAEDINDDEAADMIALVQNIARLELNIPSFSNDIPKVTELIRAFSALVVIVSLSKKGLVEIDGDGTITGDVSVSLTKNGKIAQNILKENG